MKRDLSKLTDEQRATVIKAGTPRLPARYVPHVPTPRQAAGLLCPQREVFYGGAAGGGKSDWLLMCGLQYVEVPGYAALLLRRTFADLERPGGLIPRSHEWLADTDAQWSAQHSRWSFPSGAVLQFGHMQREQDKHSYKSSEFQLVGFDELTSFLESQYRYLFSRLRRLEGSNVPIRMRSGSNPGDVGHDWVKQRMITEGRENGRIFIPARLTDNPYLDQEEYEQSLMELDPITRAQLLSGDWKVRPAGGMFKREWFEIVQSAPAKARRARGWDFAATLPKAGTDPDWTVGGKIAESEGVFYIEHIERFRAEAGGVEKRFVQTCALDGLEVDQPIEQEPGSSGKIAAAALVKAAAGYRVRPIPSTGSKAVRAAPFASQAEAGNVKLVNGPWVSDLLDELEAFAPDCSHDDQVDGLSLAFSQLTSSGATWEDLYGPDGWMNDDDDDEEWAA